MFSTFGGSGVTGRDNVETILELLSTNVGTILRLLSSTVHGSKIGTTINQQNGHVGLGTCSLGIQQILMEILDDCQLLYAGCFGESNNESSQHEYNSVVTIIPKW